MSVPQILGFQSQEFHRTEASRAVTELRRHNPRLMTTRSPLKAIQHLLKRPKQTLFRAHRDSTADDDDFRIEHIDQRSRRRREMPHRRQPDLFRMLIARCISIEQGVRVRVTAFASLRDRLIANRILEASGRV